MERYICIHGHFYQPPRENPWLESVEIQESAFPYHDWNERITAECYAANGASRIMDGDGFITSIVNNYGSISYNFGPSLLSWMEVFAPLAYRRVLEGDKESILRFSGHGSAMAQAYNHMILPLSNARDKRTQVVWGLRDFQHRYGRDPEGMWLPEAAVDLESLDLLAEHGIRFTVLAPNQAARIRVKGGTAKDWQDVSGGRIDGSRAYEITLPSGRRMALFFYDGPISRAVAFEKLLNSGETLAHRLLGAFHDGRTWPQLVHIATDGESYGHHHRFGDMALAYALHYIDTRKLARITNYGEFLELHPPTHEVEIWENSSWSCVHGVERWRSDCGCNSGGHAGWNQAWRQPLREALDFLRDAVAPQFKRAAAELLKDPWAARNDYINVILDRRDASLHRFLETHARHPLNEEETTRVLKLMELQRHAMLMYTSCGWFFDELSGIETVQVIQYAGRVLQLSRDLFPSSVEGLFLELLEKAKCNAPEHGDGRKLYEKWVRPAQIDLLKVGAHYAVSSLFQPYEDRARVFAYTVKRHDYQVVPAGRARMAIGHATVTSDITRDSEHVSFAVLHLGDHNITGGVRSYRDQDAYQTVMQELKSIFARSDLPELFRAVDRHYSSGAYSLTLLFRDEQRRVINLILESALTEVAGLYRQIYQQNAPLLQFLAQLKFTPPRELLASSEYALGSRLLNAVNADHPNVAEIRSVLDEAKRTAISLDVPGVAYAYKQTMERLSRRFLEDPTNGELLKQIGELAEMGCGKPLKVDVWQTQNLFFDVFTRHFASQSQRADNGDGSAKQWVQLFSNVCHRLSLRLPKPA